MGARRRRPNSIIRSVLSAVPTEPYGFANIPGSAFDAFHKTESSAPSLATVWQVTAEMEDQLSSLVSTYPMRFDSIEPATFSLST